MKSAHELLKTAQGLQSFTTASYPSVLIVDSFYTLPTPTTSKSSPSPPFSNCSDTARDDPKIAYFSLAVLSASVLVVHAAPLQANQAESKPSQGWNKEAIFTLIGVLVAAITIIAMVVIAFPSTRKWCASKHTLLNAFGALR